MNPAHSLRKLVLALVLSASIVVVGTSMARGATRVAPNCTASALQVTEPYNPNVAAGTVSELFVLANTGASACSMRGYPSVTFRSATGAVVVIPAVDSRGYGGGIGGGMRKAGPLPTSTLAARGGVASFWIYGTDEAVGAPPGRCWTGPLMIVTPPDSTGVVRVRARSNSPFYWCGRIFVYPVLPGRSGTYPTRPLSYFFGG